MKKNPTENNSELPAQTPYYYIENGLLVFTEAYLLKRGYCCKRSCRHCPYGNSPRSREKSKI